MNQGASNSKTAKLLHHIKTNDLFKDFSDEALQKIAANAKWSFLKKGEALFHCGDTGDKMYLVTTTGLSVTIQKEDGTKIVVAELQPGEIVGEVQFLTGGSRTADISASQESVVIELGNSTFDCLGDEKNKFIDRLNFTIRKRLQFNQLAVILPKLFGALGKNEIQAIIDRAEWIQLKRGELLFKQGEQGDAFYIVINGRLEIAIERRKHKRTQDKESGQGNTSLEWGTIVTRVGRGEIVGEMSLLTDDKRSATVYAFRDTELFRFPKGEFHHMLKQYPKLLMQITQILVERVRESGKSTKSKRENSIIAILPAGPDVPLEDFTRRLIKELSTLNSTLYVNSKKLDTFLETPGISQISEDDPNKMRVSMWLNSQEQKHRFIVFETNMAVSNWTKWCIRQADQILIVGQGAADSDPGDIEKRLLFGKNGKTAEGCLLALLHPNGEKPPLGTRKWLEKRHLPMAHHVRWDTDKDFQRIARHFAGTSIGVALSGGGARGLAHIGAIKALEEAGIPIDMVGGTSMGSIIAASYSMGWSCETMESKINQNVSDMLLDMTLPISSFFSGKKTLMQLKESFGEVHIEDLWIPFFCVSSNLTRAKKEVHRSGILWKSVLASNSAPGLLPPVIDKGDLLVDGALLSNLPVEVMDQLCHGSVIAIDVCPAVDLAENIPYGEGLSGWKILWSRINPFADPITVPDFRSILQRSGELASVANQRKVLEKMTGLYVRMPLEKYQLVDYKRASEIIETGYSFAKTKIEEWVQKRKALAIK